MEFKVHSGYSMSLGKDNIVSLSHKHKLKTKISTETELVGEDDALPQVLWSMYFTKAQGYCIDQKQNVSR